MTDRRRCLTDEVASLGDVELQLDEVEPGGDFGDRVFDLEAGVDLEEAEGSFIGLEEELDRAHSAVAGAEREPPGRGPDVGILLRGEQRATRLLDDLLVAALDGAVPQPDGPGCTVAVRDDLDLDVASPRDQALQEEGVVAKRGEGLGASLLEGAAEVLRPVDPTDTPSPAPGARLDHQREARTGGPGRPPRAPTSRDRHSRARGGCRPRRPAASTRSCRPSGASRREVGR